MSALRRIANLFRRTRLSREIDAEIQAHIDMRIEDNVGRGMAPAEARREALIRFGNPASTRDRIKAADANLGIESLARDLRFSMRQMGKSPVFTVTAICTLTIAMGGVTAAYSLLEAVLLRPLPFQQPDGLVRLHEGVAHQFEADLPAPDVIRFARDNRAFVSVAGFVGSEFELSGAGKPFQARTERITASLIPMLGVQPVLGRAFTASEDERAAPVALISNAMWKARFHADPAVIGATIDLDRRPYTIIGVMPAGFEFPLDAGSLSRRDVWVPMSFTPDEKQDETDNFQYGAIARLRPSVTLAQAQEDVRRMVAAIEAGIPPQEGIHLTSSVQLVQEETVRRTRPMLLMLVAASGLILLMACANLANLLLVRAAGRRREFGVRTALGAARLAIMRQLLTEGLVLSTIGGALGTALAWFLVRSTAANCPDSLPHINEIAIRWTVLLVAFALTGVTGILCGIAPALAGTKANVIDALKEGGRGAGSGPSQHRLRSTLAAVEIALATILLVGSGLLMRSFANMLNTDPGFHADHVLTASLNLPQHSYPTQQAVNALYGELLQRAARLPAAQSVGASTNLPIIGINSDRNFVPLDYLQQNGKSWISASNYFVLGDYFRSMRIPLVEGRLFTAADGQPNAPLVAVVSQSTARLAWPGIDPIGRRFRMGGNPKSTRPLIAVVGVVGDVRQGSLDQSVYPQMYEPFQQGERQFEPALQGSIATYRSLHVVLNTTGDPSALQASLEKTVHELDPLLAVADLRTMDSIVATTETSRLFNTGALSVFASVALALALLGIYGVTAQAVAERNREIAIRMALGATRREVLQRTLGNALKLAGVGIVSGLLASAVCTRFLSSLLYGVKPLDAVTFAGAVTLLLASSALAGWIPARRAAGIDPMNALRGE